MTVGVSVASPIPTPDRNRASCPNDRAKPQHVVDRLHSVRPRLSRAGRDHWSTSRPIGSPAMA